MTHAITATSNDTDPDSPLGRRIAVFGKGGKTTLARALAERFGLLFVELDAIRHQPNWQEMPDDEFREVVYSTLDGAEAGWVVDGNYRIVRPLVMELAETVIVLALPWRLMFWRTLKRSIKRLFDRAPLWNGNRETVWLTFFSKYSVVYDLWWRRQHFKNMETEITEQIPPGASTRVIRSASELADFYREFQLERR